ncbi:MAG: alginate lyase family protein [Capsulimonadaceae bacterium]|nr:alginate lyase family protein [Capsulimonadaceae bacterium]
MDNHDLHIPRVSRRKFLIDAAGSAFAVAIGDGLRPVFASSNPDDALLASLDLKRPGLETVRSAYARGDFASARTAFAAYLRARTKPAWYFDPSTPPKTVSDNGRRAADDALVHHVSVVGIPYTFSGPIDWTFNPTAQPGSTHALNYEWTWQLNRHYWWGPLAAAYDATGDKKYVTELVGEIGDWIAKNPPPARAANGPGSTWRTLEAGIRAGDMWPEIYFRLLRQPDVFPDDVLLSMVNSFRQHAEYLNACHVQHGNWLFTESTGLFTVGALFPEFAAANAWRTNALALLDERSRLDVYPDGFETELAPGYHCVCIDDLAGVLNLAKLEGYETPEGYLGRVENMYAAMMLASAPTRIVPPLNDSGQVNIRGLLNNALKLFPDRADWKYFAADGKEGVAPKETSHLLPWAGWASMRTGWDSDASFLLMDCGPFGLGHQHEDKLTFTLNAFGRQLVHDAGTYQYDFSEMRKYVISARGHNVIHVDGLEQHRAGQDSSGAYVGKAPAALVWETKPEYDYVSASYGREPIEGWGPKRLKNVVHTRRILFVKPDVWIVVDSLVPADTAEHAYESTFHLDAPSAVVDAATNTVTTENKHLANLAIIPLSTADLSARIITGQTQPFVQGWLPTAKSATDTGARPCVYYTRKGTGPVHFLYAFSPYKLGDAPKVASVTPGAGDGPLSALVSLTGGAKIAVSLTASGEMVVDGVGGKPLHFAAG